jgi:hypothetical protein
MGNGATNTRGVFKFIFVKSMVDAITFVTFYHRILSDIKKEIDPIYHPTIDRMLQEDPHDLITPEQTFSDYTDMFRFILQRVVRSTEN